MLTRSVSTELKVGLFAVAGFGILGTLIVTLEGNPFSSRAIDFYTVLDNVGGVGQRTQVRTSGVQVGEVTSIDILPKGARVNFKISSKVGIPKGSFIELRSKGILGDVYLEVVRAEGSEENLRPGEMIPKMKELNDMSALMASMGSIATDIKTVSSTLSKVLGSEGGKNSLQNILANIEAITADTRNVISTEKENVARIIANLRESTERVNAMLERNDGRIDEVIASVQSSMSDVKAFTSELKTMVTGPNKGRMENIIASIDDSMLNIRQASSKVQLIVDKVEKGEGTLGQLVSKDDTANDIRSTLKSIKDVLAPATKLQVEVDYKGEVRSKENVALGRYGNHFNVRLSTRPDRYYLLGISDSPAARKRVITTSSPNADGGTTTVERTPEDRGRLRFNAQFAKRYEAVGVRFGLFESYAGVAGDLYLFGDRVATAVEVFNFGDDQFEGTDSTKGFARVKAYSNVFVTPNFYVTGGADNIGRTPRPVAFVGAGLRFTDEDLKAVIGAASLSSMAK
ncbi:MAG: MCE family protein [Silvanigrellales bacterium]|nr:MCE family protein [Silvanigrellales bacterium]